MLTLACPAASLTSASVLPPAIRTALADLPASMRHKPLEQFPSQQMPGRHRRLEAVRSVRCTRKGGRSLPIAEGRFQAESQLRRKTCRMRSVGSTASMDGAGICCLAIRRGCRSFSHHTWPRLPQRTKKPPGNNPARAREPKWLVVVSARAKAFCLVPSQVLCQATFQARIL
jgi:hypothetical protein